jgi:subtilisin family serine protease/predicted  nucleic acid-binding Zn-ribbon protein
MYARLAGLLLLVLILFSSLQAYGFDLWSSGGSMSIPGPWRYWFVVLDDFSGVSDVDSLMALSRGAQEPVVRIIESLGGRVIHRHWLVNAVSFEAPPDVAFKIASLGYRVAPSLAFKPSILGVSVRGGVEPLDPIGVDTIGARRLHALGITGAGVRVAIIDTGVENDHPWLVRGGRSVVAWEVDATGTGVVDYCGKMVGYYWGGLHGTHVAGIVAGQHPIVRGVAPGAWIYDIIVFREDAYCWWAYGHDIVRGVELALLGPDGRPGTGDEADVINLSLGAIIPPWMLAGIRSGRIEDPIVRALERAVSMGKVVVVASGIDAGHMTMNFLCGAQGVICVGSSNQMGSSDRGDDRISWFSSRGPLAWFDVGPTVVAPGENILSTIPTDLARQLGLAEPALELSGTSMAAPHISGAVALLLEHYRRQGRILTVDMTSRLLVHSSTTVKTTLGSDLAGAHEAGAGLVNVYNAAFTELLVDVNGSYMLTVVALDSKVNLRLTARNIGVSTLTADITVWLDDSFRPPREGFEHAVTVTPRRITIPPAGTAEATITIDAGILPPGLYGGYVDLLVGGRSYRVVLSLVVPAKLEVSELAARSEVELLVGRHTGLGWTYLEWVLAVFYVDKPLRGVAGFRVEVRDVCASPVAIKVFDPVTGYMLSSGPPGYMLVKPGLYLVLVEVDILYSALRLACPSRGFVILEAPLLEEVVSTLQSKLLDIQSQVLTLSTRISVIESRLSDLELRLQNVESRLSSVEFTISALQSRVQGLESRVEALSQELSNVRAQVEMLSGSLEGLSSRVSSLEGYVKALASNVSRLELSIAKLESRIETLEVEVANNKAAVEGLRRDLEALRSEFTNTTRELKREIDSIRGDLVGLERRLNETSVELKSLIKASEERTARALEDLARRLNETTVELKKLVEESRAEAAKAIEGVLRRLNETTVELKALIGESEVRTAKAIEGVLLKLNQAVAELKTLIEASEAKTAKALEEQARKLNEIAVELKTMMEASEQKTAKALEEQARRVESLAANMRLLTAALDRLESKLGEANKTISLKLELLKTSIEGQESRVKMVEDRVRTLKEDLERTSSKLEEARRTLEDMISEESRQAQETARRSLTVGLAALAIGILALAAAGYTMLRSRRAS